MTTPTLPTPPEGYTLANGNVAWHLATLDEPDRSICGLGPTVNLPRRRGQALICARCTGAARHRARVAARREASIRDRLIGALGGPGQLTLLTDPDEPDGRYLDAAEVVDRFLAGRPVHLFGATLTGPGAGIEVAVTLAGAPAGIVDVDTRGRT